MARSFSAASQQRLVRTGDTFGITNWPVTIACWINPTTVTGYIVCLGSATGGRDASLILDGSNKAAVTKQNFPDSASINSTNALSAGVWQHVCGKFSSDTSMDVFVNGGDKRSTATFCTYNSNQDQGMIAANTGGGTPANFYTGSIAEIGIWNAALDDSEVAALGKGVCPTLIRPQSLVVYYPLMRNDVSGTTHLDRWRNSRNITEDGSGSPTLVDQPRIFYPI